jgi:hypothetical protein
LGNCNPE